MRLASLEKVGKNLVHYPEHGVRTISVGDWLSQFWVNPLPPLKAYILSLFPILTWIHRYNLGWLSGDLIAGLTVGIVVVPQGMSYAQVATLPPQYGLYSSIVGVFIYGFFGTSKDVSIGPTAVMSLTMAIIIKNVQGQYPGEWDAPTIATTAGLISGAIVLAIGLLRLGWLVDFIPLPTISGFMTGSAITIVSSQLPGLLGVSGFDTRAAAYSVILHTLEHLPKTTLDAAWGLSALFSLYLIKYSCNRAVGRWPRKARWFFVVNVMRNAIVIVVLTIASWLYCRRRESSKGKFPIHILQNIPAGLQHIDAPRLEGRLISALAPQMPITAIISFLEHIAIAKCFGRLTGYKINPNQELIAIGVANTVGSCFGAYPATGSFSRSALAQKSGVRTPISGMFTSVVVIIALYGLTRAFYWIPNAALCAVIIHAVADLVESPHEVYRFWCISPLEFFIWFATVLITVFASVEDGIYFSIGVSLVLLLIRLSHPRTSFLGRVPVESGSGQRKESREIFIPLKHDGVNNPNIKVAPPAPGVLVCRFEESYLYPNSSILNTVLVDYVKDNMRRGKDISSVHPRDRPWNDSVPRGDSGLKERENESKPWLHAIVLDFSSISQLDTTATQALIDARTEIERWTDYTVEFHFACILSPWTRRALIAGGFGYGCTQSKLASEVTTGSSRAWEEKQSSETSSQSVEDIEKGEVKMAEVRHHEKSTTAPEVQEPLTLKGTPFFHPDVVSAVRAAEGGLHRVAASWRFEESNTSSFPSTTPVVGIFRFREHLDMSSELISSHNVAQKIQKDDSVIILLSCSVDNRKPLFDIVTGTKVPLRELEFNSIRVTNPVTREIVYLISAPSPGFRRGMGPKEGLRYIHSCCNKVGAKLSAHVWVHDLHDTDHIWKDGKPMYWDKVQETFDELVDMESVVFLTTNWESVGLEKGRNEELRIKSRLGADVERGLFFIPLGAVDVVEVWWILGCLTELGVVQLVDPMKRLKWKMGRADEAAGRVIASRKRFGEGWRIAGLEEKYREAELEGKLGKAELEEKRRKAEFNAKRKALEQERRRRAEEGRRRTELERKQNNQDQRVQWMQHEIDILYAELSRTKEGRAVKKRLRKASLDQEKYMIPLLKQLDGEDLKPEERVKLEEKFEEEYVLCCREFRGHFGEVRQMGIAIGPRLREFYGIRDYKPKKKSKLCGIF
ncbi:hypothetical protein NP233_g1111 [Leucocoprinus birnbaumii]|uniref:STAS domain-containing protein n=1 Tax=Leucocoprinus birnbaumii TaxID=56174 RepID=A0AAD5W0Y8_9AGAR|nr:hypothetical protein NP233_g1111 [Leucocoprinus birnbaumii]